MAWMSALRLFLLLWMALPAQPFTGHIGFLARLSASDKSSLGWFWKCMSAVGILAIRHINDRDTSLVPGAASLPRDFNVTYSIRDTESNPPVGVQITLEMEQEGAHAFVGAVRSAVSGPASLVANVFKIPVISFASTAAELADKTSYPGFSRTCPSDGAAASAMVATSLKLGWKSVAVMAMDDTYGRGFAQELEGSCARLGVDVAATVRYFVTGEDSMALALEAIRIARARVILLVSFEDDLVTIATIAKQKGLIGRGFSWVLANTILDPGDYVRRQLGAPELGDMVQGFLSVIPNTLNEQQRQKMQAVWDAQDKTLVMDPLFGNLSDAHQLEGDVISPHAHMYEAVWAAALELSRSYSTQPDGTAVLDRHKLRAQVGNQRFVGPTGLVVLNDGERDQSSVEYAVLSWKPSRPAESDTPVQIVGVQVWRFIDDTLSPVDEAVLPYWAGIGESWDAPSDGASCLPGHIFNGDSLECEPCPLGHHQDGTQCVPCEVGSHGPEEGMTKCIRCSAGFADRRGMSSCTACPDNTMRLAGSPGQSRLECECTFGHYALHGPGARCEPCIAGAECRGGVHPPLPLPGFWADKECAPERACAAGDRFFSCVPAWKCLGGERFECQPGHTGRLCQEVEQGYFVVGGRWRFECGDHGVWVNVLGIVGVVFMWTLVKKVASSNYYGLRIALLYIQTTGMVSGCGMRWHGIVDHVNTGLSIFNFGVDFMSPHCIGEWTPVHRFYIQLLLPFIYVLIYSVGNLVWHARSILGIGAGPRRSVRAVVMDADTNNEMIRGGMSFCILVYHTLCIRCLESFRCREYPDGNSYMIFAPAVKCWDARHIGMVVVSSLYIPCVLVGLPAFMFYVVRSAKKDGTLHDATVMARYGFFYVRYRTEFKWWETLIMARRFSLALVFVMVEPPMLQGATAIVVLLLLLMAHTHNRPFIMEKIDYLKIFTLCGTILYALAGMLFYPSITEEAQGVLCVNADDHPSCEAESDTKTFIAALLLVWFGCTLLLAVTVAGINITETVLQHRAHKTIKHLLDKEDSAAPPTPPPPGQDLSDQMSRFHVERLGAGSSMLVARSANKLPLQALLSGRLLVEWARRVKDGDEQRQREVMNQWNFVAGVVAALPHDVTHFSASVMAATLRVLAQLPALEDYLRESSEQERANMLQTVQSYCDFLDRAADDTLRYRSAELVEPEHKPVMLCAMMTCGPEEHAALTALLDDILAVSGPRRPLRLPLVHAKDRAFAHQHSPSTGTRPWTARPPSAGAGQEGARSPSKVRVTAQLGSASEFAEDESEVISSSAAARGLAPLPVLDMPAGPSTSLLPSRSTSNPSRTP